MSEEPDFTAARRIIEDLIRTSDLQECVSQIRTAAKVDSEYNARILEGIASLAALGLEKAINDSAKPI